MARVSRADVNMPDYNGSPLTWLHNQVEFEAAVHHLLEGQHRDPDLSPALFPPPDAVRGPQERVPKRYQWAASHAF